MASNHPVQDPITGSEPPGDPARPEQALSAFYGAFNRRDLALIERTWSHDAEASLDTPVAGIRRGWPEIREAYRRAFAGPATVQAELFDYTLHRAGDLFWAVGREHGRVTRDGRLLLEVSTRAMCLFRREGPGWRQLHHHVSFDDPRQLAAFQQIVAGGSPEGERASIPPATFRTVPAGGVEVFYREAGPPAAPTLLLLHGFPSSSRMFTPLLERLGDSFHLVAPDLPGFGHSAAPPPGAFAYTFDHLARVIEAFCDRLGLSKASLYLQDYGGPVGMRLALAHPERVRALVVQNAVAHEEGLSQVWDLRRAWWRDRGAHEDEIRRNMLSIETARGRHVHGPHAERVDPDTWTDEHAFLNREGMDRVQLDLAWDYRTNVESYTAWQWYLRAHAPPLLVVWGRHDPLFTERGAWAYREDVPAAEIHLLEAGHFALDVEADRIAALVRDFLERNARA